jgi:hypothetical protein
MPDQVHPLDQGSVSGVSERERDRLRVLHRPAA